MYKIIPYLHATLASVQVTDSGKGVHKCSSDYQYVDKLSSLSIYLALSVTTQPVNCFFSFIEIAQGMDALLGSKQSKHDFS